MQPEILHYAAFTDDPAGGNPAGVILDPGDLTDGEMLAIAADLGYSESAFAWSREGAGEAPEYDVRYFSPLAEVAFCGHATVATGVALAERGARGRLLLHTALAGPVPVVCEATPGGALQATLTSPPARSAPAAPQDVAEALAALGWREAELDPALPPHVAFAGEQHLVLAARTRERLAALDYDFDRLGALMRERHWITVALLHRESPERLHARNPFPPGGVVEDPATGAAAAAVGGYLREIGEIVPPASFEILQGHDMGRPGRLVVSLVDGRPEVDVSGSAVRMA